MNPEPSPAAAFVTRAVDASTERALHRWRTEEAGEFAIPLAVPAPGTKVWSIGLPIHANRQTMLWAEVMFDCGASADQPFASGYRTTFVVEWAGWNTLHLTVSSLEAVGAPAGLPAIKRLRLRAISSTFAGTILELGAPTWSGDSPLIAMTPGEDMVVNFLSARMWDRGDWQAVGPVELPAEEQGLEVGWMYANLRYLQRPGRAHRIAYRRRMEVDISGYQAVTVWTATDRRAQFSLVLEIDGVAVRAIDRRRGLGGGDEMRALISGRRLTALTLELEQVESAITDAVEAQVATSLRWILLERTGTDPAQAGQVAGMPPVPPPARVEPLETTILPVGIMIDRESFLRLRDASRSPGPLKKMADEIIAEATAHLGYEPERYVGRYLPVDLGNQGCERKVSPADQMYDVNSCMVYGAVAYALTGDLRHGQTARRGLFATLRCTTWQAGFPSRIPCGLPGYRAPFVEASTAECVAQCYDFIYPLLSAPERRAVEDALHEKALPWIDMYLRYCGEGYLLNSNQGAVFMAGLVSAALVARRSHPEVDALLERSIAWFPRMMNNYYNENGASNEGPGYWEYTTQHAAAALIAISRYKGWWVQDYAPPHLAKTMDYLMHLRSLAKDRFSFLPLSDNIEAAGYEFINSSLLFFAKYYDDANALWLWHEYFGRRPNPPGSPFFGKRMAGACSLSGLMNFLLYVEGAPPTPRMPPHKHFAGCDRFMLRTGCTQGDMLFFFEGGPQTFEHTHNDKGQFMLEAYGERFAADPGTIKYQDPAHLFYKQTSYHNLVTLRGRDQDYADPQRAVVLKRVDLGGVCDYLSVDLVNSYRGFDRYRRRMLFVRPHYFLILDDVQANETGLEWNYQSGVPISDINLASGLIRFQGARAAMLMAVGSRHPLKSTVGAHASDGVVLSHQLVLAPKVAASSLTLAALLLPFPLTSAGRPEPAVQVASTSGIVTFTVSGFWGIDTVRCTLAPDSGDADPLIEVRRAGEPHETIFATRD
uniref:heparinase II/III domain-containing protein n=1 Tax=Cephaloticoccus sp. TaxID=1985742 RepID=UPI00404A3152